jgi:hypothetical protein
MLSALLKNKTTVVNAMTVAVGVLGYLAGNEVIVQHPEWTAALLSAVGALNVVVRLFGGSPAPTPPVAK